MQIENNWKDTLQKEIDKPYFQSLMKFVDKEYSSTSCFPPYHQILNAFELTPLEEVKVVILGQDPYHGQGQAHGLAFSVPEGIKIPPSLRNIYKELIEDVNFKPTFHGDLSSWATQGVLLLNTTLTVREGAPGSHQNQGWERFTDEVIRMVSQQKENVVFILWGTHAQKKSDLIDAEKHLIISSTHPSPLSAYRGFFGSNPFSKTNAYLIKSGKNPIDWQI